MRIRDRQTGNQDIRKRHGRSVCRGLSVTPWKKRLRGIPGGRGRDILPGLVAEILFAFLNSFLEGTETHSQRSCGTRQTVSEQQQRNSSNNKHLPAAHAEKGHDDGRIDQGRKIHDDNPGGKTTVRAAGHRSFSRQGTGTRNGPCDYWQANHPVSRYRRRFLTDHPRLPTDIPIAGHGGGKTSSADTPFYQSFRPVQRAKTGRCGFGR